MKFENHSQLPFEVGKTYSTKFQTGEKFVITEIKWRTSKDKEGVITNLKIIYFIGYYEKHPHIQNCMLNFDRLIPENKTMELIKDIQTNELASKFVDFDSAHQMKKLGFNEKCIGYFENERKNLVVKFDNSELTEQQAIRPKLYSYWSTNKELPQWATAAPLWQDAFEWFDKKYNLYPQFQKTTNGYVYFIFTNSDQFEECFDNDLKMKKACLKKLIALASEKI